MMERSLSLQRNSNWSRRVTKTPSPFRMSETYYIGNFGGLFLYTASLANNDEAIAK